MPQIPQAIDAERCVALDESLKKNARYVLAAANAVFVTMSSGLSMEAKVLKTAELIVQHAMHAVAPCRSEALYGGLNL
jgi:hypothetical protein